MKRILPSSALIRTRYITSILLLLFFTVFCTIAQEQKATITTDKDDYWPDEWVIITGTGWQNDDSVRLTLTHLDPLPDPYHPHPPWFVNPDANGIIYYKWFVSDQELGTSFELRAVGFAKGIPTSDYAVTYFMDASITNVTVNGSSFCDGQPVTVSYTSGAKFDNNNFFTAQLSDTSGSFSSPVIIGTLNSKQSGAINAIIPSGTTNGQHYRIRVVSSKPVITSNPNATDLTINVSPTAPAFVTATPSAICAGSSSNLNATSSGNSIRWYTTGTGGSLLGTSASGANFSVTPSIATTYYAEALNAAGCSSPARTKATVTVNPIPTITSTTPGSVCASGTVTLTAASSAGIINWYSEATGGVILGTGISFNTPVITINTTYYVDAIDNGCITSTRTPVIATVNTVPTAPIAGTVTQPTCAVSTGSVVLNGLPATGTWTLTRTPGGTTTTGTGTSTTITGLAAGTYTYTVTNASGCISPASATVLINAQPEAPPAPIAGTVTQPTCAVSTGSVVLNGLPATGTWILTRTPGGTTTAGTGTSTTITGLATGTYTYTVTNSSGCTSIASANVIINTKPAAPEANAGTGGNECGLNFRFSAVPSFGTGIWTRTTGPGTATFIPDAYSPNATVTVSDYGNYTFTWTETNNACSSSSMINVVFYQQPVANAGTGGENCGLEFNLVATPSIGTGTWAQVNGPGSAIFSPNSNTANAKVTVSQFGSYDFAWTEASTLCSSTDIVRVTFHDLPLVNAGANTAVCKGRSIQLNAIGSGSFRWTPANLVNNYAISNPIVTPVTTSVLTVTLTDVWGCKNSDQVSVEVKEQPVANAGPDQVLEFLFGTTLNATALGNGETGEWTIISGTGEFANKNDNATQVSKLSLDKNSFTWTLTNGVCPSSSDTIDIIVHDLIIPTLITPNKDGRNEYFIIRGIETLGKTELVIFNRWGVRVYLNNNYDNKWDGVDENENPLPEDTYFFILRPEKSKPFSGYIVVRR